MRLISVNLNKRLGNAQVARFLEVWLQRRACDVLLVQEPWSRKRELEIQLRGYKAVGGNSSVFTWIENHYAMPAFTQHRLNWQEVKLGYMIVHNVYLSAYSSSQRTDELLGLHNEIKKTENRPLLIVGDFNLAPRPEDGVVGGNVSSWTSASERKALNNLMSTQGLLDMTAGNTSGSVEYSIERKRDSGSIAFRCDLALTSDFISQDVTVTYDHSTRTGPAAFTDHSALIIDAPVTLTKADLFSRISTEGSLLSTDENFQPQKTAMARSSPSRIAMELHTTCFIETHGICSVLDYGCGRGKDVLFYRSLGVEAYGYDPYEPFGWNAPPNRKYDLVTLVFVLNVIANPCERMDVLQSAAEAVKDGGYLFVATRSPLAIRREVVLKGWKTYNDGYISHDRKHTFQKGIGCMELELMLRRVGLKMYEWNVKLGIDTAYILAKRVPAPNA